MRPGAIIESGYYRGTNKALLYRDVVLRLVRDPKNPSQTVLLMKVTVKLWKEIATPAERNQIMGHTNSYIFKKFYQNRVIKTDISAAFLKIPSRSSLLASVGHIDIDRNPRAPVHLDTNEQDAALADQNFVYLKARIKSLRTSIYKKHSRLKYKTTTNKAQKKQLRELQRSRQTLRKRLLKDAANEKRIRFFHCIDSDDIRQAKHGVPVTYSPPLQVYALGARANLASILNRVSPDGVTARQRGRIEALQNLIDLCHTREPHHRNPASRASKGATA
ncbi:MAG: hypothetical protein Q9175_006985 [Cornicularia normoerica]